MNLAFQILRSKFGYKVLHNPVILNPPTKSLVVQILWMFTLLWDLFTYLMRLKKMASDLGINKFRSTTFRHTVLIFLKKFVMIGNGEDFWLCGFALMLLKERLKTSESEGSEFLSNQ